MKCLWIKLTEECKSGAKLQKKKSDDKKHECTCSEINSSK